MKEILLNQDRILFSYLQGSFAFRLDMQMVLAVFFHPDSKKSFCASVRPGSRSPEECLKWVYSQVKLEEKNKFSVKLLCTSEGSPSTGSMIQRWEKALSDSGFSIDGRVERKNAILGALDFNLGKLRVEKSSLNKVKVLIVDDSKTIRDLLSKIFSQDDQIEIVGTAEDPLQVEALIPVLKPDVITLDIHMPGLNGVELLRRYLPKYKIPTVMISSISMEDGSFVLNALESGAVDYIQKPTFSELEAMTPIMIEKIKAASKAKVKLQEKAPIQRQSHSPLLNAKALVVIGSSTGGTEALKQVFLAMPKEIPPILVVQHIPAVFSKAFADRLNQICPFEVKEAADGDEIKPNRVLIAPGGFQMAMVEGNPYPKVKIKDDLPVNRHKPSVDYLFQSAHLFAKKFDIVAAILTGMGADGARGMKMLKENGARTIAQDENTSVVFGMPREAIRLGGVDSVVPLDQIASKIIEFSAQKERKRFA